MTDLTLEHMSYADRSNVYRIVEWRRKKHKREVTLESMVASLKPFHKPKYMKWNERRMFREIEAWLMTGSTPESNPEHHQQYAQIKDFLMPTYERLIMKEDQ